MRYHGIYKKILGVRKKMYLERMNLQLFGANGEGSGSEGAGNTAQQNNNQQNNNQNNQNSDGGAGEKTYTQAQVNAMLANEKRQGKQAILRALGIKDVNEGKSKMQQQQQANQQQLDEENQAAQLLSNARQAQINAEARAQAAERKLSVLKAGVRPEFVDDVVYIATGKATDAEDFEEVVTAMKETHSFYFMQDNNSNQNNNGTGGNANFKKQQQQQEQAGALGKRLAEQRMKAVENKVKFFDN